jgi:hypothetical protein
MTRQRDAMFDDRIADWLENDPTTAPREVLDTVLAALPSIPQRTTPWWRWVRFQPAMRLAVAVSLIVAVGLVALTVWRLPGVGPPGPSPTPSSPPATPAFGLSGDVVAYTSPWYGYTIDRPAEWSVREATEDLAELGPPWIDSTVVDYVAAQPAGALVPGIIVASTELAPGRTLDEWTDLTTVATCGPLESRQSIPVDGETGLLLEYPRCLGYHHLWVTVVRGTTGFHIVWISLPGTEAEDRLAFERVLASFRFPPAPEGSPAPS